jgi:hypothetical protein
MAAPILSISLQAWTEEYVASHMLAGFPDGCLDSDARLPLRLGEVGGTQLEQTVQVMRRGGGKESLVRLAGVHKVEHLL